MEYKQIANKIKPLNDKQNLQLLKEKEYTRVMEGNMRYAIKLAHKYSDNDNELEIIHQATIGLWLATQNFDITTDSSFISYATNWIKKCIINHYHEQKVIRLPRNKINALNKLNSIYKDEFFNIYDYEHLFEKSDFKYLLNEIDIVSGDATIGQESDEVLFDRISIDEQKDDVSEQMYPILKYLDTLKTKDKDIIIKVYGLDGNEPMTCQAIGNELGVTKQAIVDRKNKLIKKLQKKFCES